METILSEGRGLDSLCAGWDVPGEEGGFPGVNQALLTAACDNLPHCARFLIKTTGADVNWADITGSTPMHVAAASGSCAVLRVLLAAGGVVNTGDSGGFSPLIDALRHGAWETEPEIVRTLLGAGACVNKPDLSGATAVHHAATVPTHVELLLDEMVAAGADVNVADLEGDTPLLWAVWNRNKGCAAKLMTLGAEVNVANAKEETPILMALWCGFPLELLLKAGADVNSTENLLLEAMLARDVGSVRLLLRHGVPVDPDSLPLEDCEAVMLRLGLAAGAGEGLLEMARGHEWGRTSTASRGPGPVLPAGPIPAIGDEAQAPPGALGPPPRGSEWVRALRSVLPRRTPMTLQGLCRRSIRDHLLKVSKVNLFVRVPELGITHIMTSYLLYGQSVHGTDKNEDTRALEADQRGDECDMVIHLCRKMF